MQFPLLRPRTILVALMVSAAAITACTPSARVVADPEPAKEPEKKPGLKVGTFAEVRFLDGSVLKLTVLEERLAVQTAYGKLLVPLATVRSIDFATRVPAEVTREVEAAIADLGCDQFKKREEAGERLMALGAAAYPALLEAVNSSNKETARRAENLVAAMRDTLSEEQLEIRKHDIVVTGDGKFTGKIDTDTFKAKTAQFGGVSLQLHLVRSLRTQKGPDEASDAAVAQADPGTLISFHEKLGKRLVFRVTGNTTGTIYGTDVYTTDSTLATAAVHAGVLKDGQTGLVRVRMVAPPPAGFISSTRNGITSNPWAAYPVAYQILKGP
jgi:hypothetical protein